MDGDNGSVEVLGGVEPLPYIWRSGGDQHGVGRRVTNQKKYVQISTRKKETHDHSETLGRLVLIRISGNESVIARKDTSAPLGVLLTDTQGVPSSRSHILTLKFDTVVGAGQSGIPWWTCCSELGLVDMN